MKDAAIMTVIIPTYNSQDTIEKCLNSVISQNIKQIEIIVVDDGSSDSTVNKVKQIQKKTDVCLKLYKQKNNGPGSARNNGIKRASGKYVTFLDSDDYYDGSYFESVLSVISSKNPDIIFIETVNEKKDGKIIGRDHICRYAKRNKDELVNLQTAGIISWGPCSKIVKKEIADQCTFSNMKVGEDAIYSFGVLTRATSIAFVEKPLYHYVYNTNGQHAAGGDNPWGELLSTIKEVIDRSEKPLEYRKGYYLLSIQAKIINAYRLSSRLTNREAAKAIRPIFKEVEDVYAKAEKKDIKWSIKVLIIFSKMGLYFPIIFASKIRSRNRIKGGCNG